MPTCSYESVQLKRWKTDNHWRGMMRSQKGSLALPQFWVLFQAWVPTSKPFALSKTTSAPVCNGHVCHFNHQLLMFVCLTAIRERHWKGTEHRINGVNKETQLQHQRLHSRCCKHWIWHHFGTAGNDIGCDTLGCVLRCSDRTDLRMVNQQLVEWPCNKSVGKGKLNPQECNQTPLLNILTQRHVT